MLSIKKASALADAVMNFRWLCEAMLFVVGKTGLFDVSRYYANQYRYDMAITKPRKPTAIKTSLTVSPK